MLDEMGAFGGTKKLVIVNEYVLYRFSQPFEQSTEGESTDFYWIFFEILGP